MSVGLLKKLVFGVDSQLTSPADVIYIFEQWKGDIKPESFNPLIPLIGGVSVVVLGRGSDKSVQALLIGNDWINLCVDAGAEVKNAVICLASNFDEDVGMVAMSLELAMIANKPRTEERLRLDMESFVSVVTEVFSGNYGGVTSMANKWGVEMKKDLPLPQHRSRLKWRQELGFDVLIHPVSLEPCKKDGEILEYLGVDLLNEKEASFRFRDRKSGEEISFREFPLVA